MTTLGQFIQRNKLDGIECMNRLQDAAIVSDNAVLGADVAEADGARAVEFLTNILPQLV
jgi:hypothetical protein